MLCLFKFFCLHSLNNITTSFIRWYTLLQQYRRSIRDEQNFNTRISLCVICLDAIVFCSQSIPCTYLCGTRTERFGLTCVTTCYSALSTLYRGCFNGLQVGSGNGSEQTILQRRIELRESRKKRG